MYGFMPDAAMARVWYEKATELGSLAAPRRLEMLTKETGHAEKRRLQPLAMGIVQMYPKLSGFLFIAALDLFLSD